MIGIIGAVTRWITILLGCALALTTIASGATLFQHIGSNNPTTEGWTDDNLGSPTTGVFAGPVINDQNTGMDAWTLGYPNEEPLRSYEVYPTSAQVTQAATFGWELTADLRIATVPVNSFFSVDANLSILPNIPITAPQPMGYSLVFTGDSEGNVVVSLIGGFTGVGVSFDLQNPTDYHLYQLEYDPVSKTADWFVDGVEEAANMAGSAMGSPRIDWGTNPVAQANSVAGQVNFNLIRFDIVPEPDSFILLALASAGLLLHCRR
jgi:hypothetical protein